MFKLMNSLIAWILAILLATAGFLSQAILTNATANPATVILNAPDKVPVNAVFTVPVDVNQVTLLNAANYRITYDAELIALDNVTDGTIGTTTIPVDGYKEVQPGYCNIVNFMRDVTGVTGSGTLAILHFHALSKTGETEIQITKGVLSDNTASKIEASWTGDCLTVAPKSSSGNGGGRTSSTQSATPTSGIDSSGKFISQMTVASEDNQASIIVESGTTGLNAEGNPLTEITINPVLESLSQSPGNYAICGQVFDLGPQGATFDSPITLIFEYDPTQFPADLDQSSLVISWYDADNQEWVNLESVVDTVNHTVSASITHFSVFAIMMPVLAKEPTQTPAVPTMTAEPTQTTAIPTMTTEPTHLGDQIAAAQETQGPIKTTDEPAVEEPTPGLNWALIGGLIGVCALLLIGVIVFRTSINRRNK